LLGYITRDRRAWLLVLFLIQVTDGDAHFGAVKTPQAAQLQSSHVHEERGIDRLRRCSFPHFGAGPLALALHKPDNLISTTQN